MVSDIPKPGDKVRLKDICHKYTDSRTPLSLGSIYTLKDIFPYEPDRAIRCRDCTLKSSARYYAEIIGKEIWPFLCGAELEVVNQRKHKVNISRSTTLRLPRNKELRELISR